MAQSQPQRQPTDWVQEGRNAILDLLQERLVIPWFEAESRIASHGWREFRTVQPLQLHEAKISLVNDGLIIPETTDHPLPVVTIRLPFPEGRTRELTRLRGARRKLYRRYLSWTNDTNLCGRHAEKVVLDSTFSAASDAGLYVPRQTVGHISEIQGIPVKPGPLDALAHILDLPILDGHIPLLIEVKNINHWIYPWSQELWQCLVKAASVATTTPVLPLLVCMRSVHMTNQMAKDIGFFTCQLNSQLFSPAIDQTAFRDVVEDFDLVITQHDGPFDPVVTFLTKILRRSPPASPPYEEEIPWYRRQTERFQIMAPTILAHAALAETLPDLTRTSVLNSFTVQARTLSNWPLVGGWYKG